MLVANVLKTIPDESSVVEIIASSQPAADLVKAYRELSINIDEAPVLNDIDTGAKLKEYIELLDSGYQVDLLAVFRNRLRPKQVLEDPEAVEKRKLRTWLIKAGFICASVFMVAVLGATVALGYKQGVMPDSSVLTGFINTAGEVLKLIFSS